LHEIGKFSRVLVHKPPMADDNRLAGQGIRKRKSAIARAADAVPSSNMIGRGVFFETVRWRRQFRPVGPAQANPGSASF
jgi:hypothetical protein